MTDLKNIKWIEINLPWNYNDDSEKYPKPPNLDEREREVFGISLVEADKNIEKDIEKYSQLLNELRSLQDEAIQEADAQGIQYSDFIISSEYNRIESDFWKKHQNDSCVIARDSFKDLQTKIFAWSDEQPEWKAHAKAVEEYRQQENLKSFSGRGLNKPGTLIELENGQIELIGSINTATGVCNDCPAFDSNSVVKRYAVVCPFSRKKANDEK